jgi:hypothetical protein
LLPVNSNSSENPLSCLAKRKYIIIENNLKEARKYDNRENVCLCVLVGNDNDVEEEEKILKM